LQAPPELIDQEKLVQIAPAPIMSPQRKIRWRCRSVARLLLATSCAFGSLFAVDSRAGIG
jgi:hypothetical protein